MASRRIDDLSALDWDDSALIKAYNKGMSLRVKDFQKEDSKDKQSGDKKDKKGWKVGDYCRAVYPHDNLVYEAEIIDIEGEMCTVDFLGYDEEIELELESLTKSKGKLARKKQIKGVKGCLGESADESTSADNSRNEYSESEHSHQRKRDESYNHNHTMNHSTQYSGVEGNYHPASMKLQRPYATGMMPVPPVPPMVQGAAQDPSLCAMMSAWYMAGYYTGLREGQKLQCSSRCCQPHNCCQPSNNFCHH